ncbi:DNA polymerase III subunit epsilon [Skermanella stibiiresistens SB22]|uniref:DNA polymerase III subunit epsilon n=1 Tax=Skermanella stibiiresistens SB22 TaxID=1385369 RepID=W9H727_9PROT|nr:DNA polymerase III subunit epsilon [Skermanella stibiiresistens]EWY40576.1 DNA polymerase III subunit epsilon [Skermanella stibiiresistens SB22]
MREIILDTETTGFDPLTGHRIVEIGCVEAINYIPTDKQLHLYINPERDMPAEAQAVHGLSEEFLRDKPVFAEVCGEFLDFIGDSRLIIHNAEFDMRFINAELKRLGMPTLPMTRALDTVAMARRKFPGAPASLDALCRRFNIDNSNRTLHGALLDAQLLGEVYLELQGGRQPDLVLAGNRRNADGEEEGPAKVERVRRQARVHAPTAEEAEAHAAMLAQLKNPMWLAGAS